MMKFHRFEPTRSPVYVNPEHIVTVEQLTMHDYSVSPWVETHTTRITLITRDIVQVLEPVDEVIKRMDFYFANQVDLMMVDQGRPM
jgi:uncharacterized protein YlzI (FlbEa/FlbD family)